MNDLVTDTNALLWFLFDRPRLSPPALAALDAAEASGTIAIPSITLVEIVYLTDRFTFPYPHALAQIEALVSDPYSPYELLPLTLDESLAVQLVPRVEVPDMPDRIIAATAVAYQLPLVSSDSMIRSSPALRGLVPVIW